MTKEKKAKIILKELDNEYSVPSYMEEYAIRGIIKALSIIEKKEEKGE